MWCGCSSASKRLRRSTLTSRAPIQVCTLRAAAHRELHKIPELAFEEDRTSAYIRAQLKKLGIPFKQCASPTPQSRSAAISPDRSSFWCCSRMLFPSMDVASELLCDRYDKPEGARTGTVGTLGSGEPRFVLRSDIDALPIKVDSVDINTNCHAIQVSNMVMMATVSRASCCAPTLKRGPSRWPHVNTLFQFHLTMHGCNWTSDLQQEAATVVGPTIVRHIHDAFVSPI